METTIFNGKEFAGEKEKSLKKGGITPKLVSILIGDNPGSKFYLSLKKKAAERIGAELQVINLSSSTSSEKIIQTIQKYNKDKKIHGIMVQLPFPKNFTWDERQEVINSISPHKDVDGMREDSPFVAPVVKAVLQSIEEARLRVASARQAKKVVVVGSKGFVGKKIMKELRTMNYELYGYDIDTKNLGKELLKADIIVSAAGVPDLIKGNMVKDGAVVIDVGSPKGDVAFDEISKKAAFITPVPGGIGPVTIACLLENLLIAAENLVK